MVIPFNDDGEPTLGAFLLHVQNLNVLQDRIDILPAGPYRHYLAHKLQEPLGKADAHLEMSRLLFMHGANLKKLLMLSDSKISTHKASKSGPKVSKNLAMQLFGILENLGIGRIIGLSFVKTEVAFLEPETLNLLDRLKVDLGQYQDIFN